MTGSLATLALVLLLGAADAELEVLERDFQYGQYGDVYPRAVARIDAGGLSEDELLQVQKIAGLSAYYLGDQAGATRHLQAVLRLSPDFALDPFVVPPAAISFFEKLKKDLEQERFVLRQERRARDESLRREKELQERVRKENEEQRRRLEQLSRRVTVREVQRPSFLVNFVPFGAGQFQQGRNGRAVALAAAQGTLAATSIISYLAYGSLIESRNTILEDRQVTTGRVTLTQVGIPEARRREAETWKVLKYGSAAGFYALYAYGVGDALYHHQDEVVLERTLEAPSPLPHTPDLPAGEPREVPPGQRRPLTPTGSLSPDPFVFPLHGGAGAGFALQF